MNCGTRTSSCGSEEQIQGENKLETPGMRNRGIETRHTWGPLTERWSDNGSVLPASNEGTSAHIEKAQRTQTGRMSTKPLGAHCSQTEGTAELGRRPNQRHESGPPVAATSAEAFPKQRKTDSPPTMCYPAQPRERKKTEQGDSRGARRKNSARTNRLTNCPSSMPMTVTPRASWATSRSRQAGSASMVFLRGKPAGEQGTAATGMQGPKPCS